MARDDVRTGGRTDRPGETRLRRRRLLALAGASLTAGLAGGGGDDATPTATATNTPTPGETDSTDAVTTAPTETTGEGTGTPTDTRGDDTPVQPIPDTPSSLVSIEGGSVQAGGTGTLSGTLLNPYLWPVRAVEVSLEVPEGWSVSATGETEFDAVAKQGTRELAWDVTAPEDAAGEYTIDGTVHYETTTDAVDVPVSTTVFVFGDDFGAGLAAHWGFEPGSVTGGTVADRSGNGNDGTIVGDPGLVSGAVGQGLDLDGDGDWIRVPHDDSLQVQTGDFTLAGWINTRRSSGNAEALVSKKTGDGVPDAELAYQLCLNGYGAPANAPVFVYATGSGLATSQPGTTLSAGSYSHLAVAYDHDGQSVDWYVDGAHVTTDSLSGTPITNGHELFLGVHFNSAGEADQAVNGVLDEIRIYGERKSQGFLRGLYEQGSPPSE